jgi:hypothetical protein
MWRNQNFSLETSAQRERKRHHEVGSCFDMDLDPVLFSTSGLQDAKEKSLFFCLSVTVDKSLSLQRQRVTYLDVIKML